jgi:uncharacterized protein DUF4234
MFLGMFTLGIYYLYWFYSINSEAAVASRDENAKPGLSLLAASLGAFLIIPLFWTHWTTAKRVGVATGRHPHLIAQVAFSILLLPFAAILYTWWLQGKMNRYVRQQMMTGTASLA